MNLERMKILIGLYILARQELLALDPLSDATLPNLAAAPQLVEQLEFRLQRKLPEGLKAFLLCANGWPEFFAMTDIFSTEQMPEAQKLLEEWPWIRKPFRHAKIKDVFIIGGSTGSDTVVLTDDTGRIFEYGRGDFSEYENFETYLEHKTDTVRYLIDNPIG